MGVREPPATAMRRRVAAPPGGPVRPENRTYPGHFHRMQRSRHLRIACRTWVLVMGHLLGAHQTGQLMRYYTGQTICS